jgi:UDP-N-acetylenolpyruvoylglucosamine reductase
MIDKPDTPPATASPTATQDESSVYAPYTRYKALDQAVKFCYSTNPGKKVLGRASNVVVVAALFEHYLEHGMPDLRTDLIMSLREIRGLDTTDPQ